MHSYVLILEHNGKPKNTQVEPMVTASIAETFEQKTHKKTIIVKQAYEVNAMKSEMKLDLEHT